MWKSKVKENWHLAVIFCIVILLVVFRLTSYGDPKLSIGTNDSSSYFDQVRVPTFSWEALTVRRLPSYVILFKLFEPKGGYDLKAISYPAAPTVGTQNKQLQSGFDNVVLSQMWLSIIAWVFFALMIARHLKNKYLKVLSVFLILFFAFLPQIAEWDSVLMSESVSFSLFMVMLGISMELISRLMREVNRLSLSTWLWVASWFLIFVLWAFMRDSNANIIIIPVIFVAILLLFPRIRKQLPVWPFVGLGTILLGIFVIYAISASQSGRWMGSWDDLYYGYIAPYPEHMQFFYDHGMPQTNVREWATINGAKTYLEMLMIFPRFTVDMFIYQMEDVFSENIQPFFYTFPSTGYRTLVALGNMFHPLSSLTFPFALLAGVLVIIKAFTDRTKEKLAWGWMTIWMLLMAYCYYGFGFFGDSAGIIRHLLGAVMPMRLMVWLFPIVLADFT